MHTVVDAIVASAGPGTLTVLESRGDATPISWAQLHDQARRMAAVLAGEGIGPASRVGLLADTGVTLVTAIQAVWLAGAAVTVLPPPLGAARREQLAAISADAGLHLLLHDQSGTGADAPTRTLPLDVLAARAAHTAPAPPVRPEPTDLAILQYTSGSTRSPQGVPVTHAHLAANLAAIRAATGHDSLHPARILSWLPLHHDMGLIGFLALPMSCGCSLVLQPPAAFARRPASWLEAMSRHRITISGAPNFAYSLLARAQSPDLHLDLSRVQLLLSGAEPIDPVAMAAFATAAARHGLRPSALLPAYGLAESTLAVTFSAPGAGVRVDRIDACTMERAGRAEPDPRGRELVRLGKPVPGTSLRIVDTGTGTPIGARIVGRIEISGPSVVGHYWPDPPPPAGAWFPTGDLGYVTEAGDDGELVVCGRECDLLFAAGRNIFPQDIEAAAGQVSGVRPGGVAAFGVDGDQLVVAVESIGTDPDAVRRAVTAAVGDEVGLAPNRVLVLPYGRLPKSSSGKLRRAEARRRYLSGRLPGAPS